MKTYKEFISLLEVRVIFTDDAKKVMQIFRKFVKSNNWEWNQGETAKEVKRNSIISISKVVDSYVPTYNDIKSLEGERRFKQLAQKFKTKEDAKSIHNAIIKDIKEKMKSAEKEAKKLENELKNAIGKDYLQKSEFEIGSFLKEGKRAEVGISMRMDKNFFREYV